jgi:hypothetical protein
MTQLGQRGAQPATCWAKFHVRAETELVEELRHRPSQVGQLLGALHPLAQQRKQRLLEREDEGRGFRGREAVQRGASWSPPNTNALWRSNRGRVVRTWPSPCSRDCRRLAALKPALRTGERTCFAPAYGEYLESYAAITEDWNSDDVGACSMHRPAARAVCSATGRGLILVWRVN